VFRRRSPDITPVSFEVSLFGDPRIEARLPAPRGLSQVTTSFIGSWCLGIHRLPLVACCYYKDARVHCEVLNTRAVAQTGRPEEQPALVRTEVSHPSPPKRTTRPKLQDPTACPNRPTHHLGFPLLPEDKLYSRDARYAGSIVNVPHSRAAGVETNAPPTSVGRTPRKGSAPPSSLERR
jgi:hypothetical protein